MNSADRFASSPSTARRSTGAGVATDPCVGVLGHFGDSNLGDEAIIEAFVTRVRREWPCVELRIFSMHPGDSRRRYGCQAYALRHATEYEDEFRPLKDFLAESETAANPTASNAAEHTNAASATSLVKRLACWLGDSVPRGRVRSGVAGLARSVVGVFRELGFLRRCFRRVRGLDVMYITGSNQFLDNFGGPWGFPYTLLKWTLLCRLSGCRVAFVSVGAGPLDRWLSHRMIAVAVRMSDYVSFRDEGSRQLIREATRLDGPVLPDLAHSLLPLAPKALNAGPNGRRSMRIAINAMPVHDPRYWHRPDEQKYRRYVDSLMRVCRALTSEGHEISFFATQFPDANVARDVVKQAFSKDADPPGIRVPTTVQELLRVIQQADVVLATRFHGILLSLLMERPTVGICYYRKSRELLAEAGLGSYAFDIDDFDAAALESAVKRLISQRDEVTRGIAKHGADYRDALEAQYKVLFDIARAHVPLR